MVEKFTKYKKEEIYSMETIFDLAHPEEAEKLKKLAEENSKSEKVTFYEARYVTKDKKVRWVYGYMIKFELFGKKYFLGNWIDVTTLKRYEMELKNSEEFLRTLIDESLAPIYILQNGRMVYVNKSFEEVTGYRVEEVLGKDPFFIVHPEDRRMVYEKYLAREGGKLGIETYSYKIVTKSGATKWVTVRPSRIIYNGKPAVAATAIDTTELHETKVKLEKRNEYLRFLNKILRHDIANALTFIRFALEDKEDEMSKKAVERIDYIVRLINDVRTLEAALDELVEIRLDKVVEEVAKSYDVNFKVEEVSVLANEGLYSVVDNLIRNAIVHGGGEVEVEVLKENNSGVLRVKDRGKGVPKEIREKIFEEGFTTGKGTGMGLYIVKKLVEIYGGEVRVYDNVPHGAIFEVRLKVTKRQA